MKLPSELTGLRIGSVPYFNAAPLIYGLEGINLLHPSVLAKEFQQGAVDIALVPVVQGFAGGKYRVVDGVGVTSSGPVLSVFVAHLEGMDQVERVRLDPASRTSATLVQVLLQESPWIEFSPMLDDSPPVTSEDAMLLIGDQALEFRRIHGNRYQYYDLAEEWFRQTGLPFVFAVWLIHEDLEEETAQQAATFLRQLAAYGQENLEKMIHLEAARQHIGDSAFCRHYITQAIKNEMGEAERKGVHEFYKRYAQWKKIPAEQQEFPLVFI